MPGPSRRDAPVKAVLGPTNTGKTHLAVERMLAHRTGMIGLPLRLLAREIYDRVVKAKGARAAALVTGEEKIGAENAPYVVATVEAMPLERGAEFIAIDEIQLARDPDRGHIFTDRLLHARGAGETMLLGAETMRPMIRALLPYAEIAHRERLSKLSYAGPKKLAKLPKRSAIVAFSAEEVYAIAELIRRHRGGAAVVMGALSPRTRNAQVELYQSGEVDFLVATDAIGMGLNMDVDHVAFASSAKFDGRRTRVLRADEIAQIAGRAGRFRSDGAFGETGQCGAFDEEIVARVENHEFEPVEMIEWRNRDLRFSSIAALIASLEKPPQAPGLMRARGASDEETLKRLALEPDIVDLAQGAHQVARLWEVCQTPDFRKTTLDEHASLILRMAAHLLGPKQRLPDDWMAREIKELDRTEGDLDVLQARLAHIRTWTYVANRADWIDDSGGWRVRTREIEDRISDALHEALSQRFVDRRTSALLKGLKREEALRASVSEGGDVLVEGHFVGRLEGLVFKPDPSAFGLEGRAVRNAAARALDPEVAARLAWLAAAPAEAFELSRDGRMIARDQVFARLAPSPVLAPRLALIGAEGAPQQARAAALTRMEQALSAWAAFELAPLAALTAAWREGALPASARGLAFRLSEAGGALSIPAAREALEELTPEARKALSRLGVRFGRIAVYMPSLLKPSAIALHAILRAGDAGLTFAPGPRTRTVRLGAKPDDAVLAAAGFIAAGAYAVRIDAAERAAHALTRKPGPETPPFDAAIAGKALGLPKAEVEKTLRALGLRKTGAPAGPAWRMHAPTRREPGAAQAAGPFAALAALSKPDQGGA